MMTTLSKHTTLVTNPQVLRWVLALLVLAAALAFPEIANAQTIGGGG